MKFKDLFPLLKATYAAFSEDKVYRLASSLSYFAVFSIAPVLVVIISIAAIFFSEQTARAQIMAQIGEVVGPTGANAVGEILTNANKGGQSGNIWASVIGFGTILAGASGLFAALQDSLNTIWGVAPKPDAGVLYMIRSRFISFSMVLGIGFMLMVSLVLSTAVKGFADQMGQLLGGAEWVAPFLNVVIFFGVITVMFGMMFKILPDAKIDWRDVWTGAALTSVLFSVGKYVLSWYLARPGTASAYGSAGALVVLLLWIYYASYILFFGAEFTKVYANKFGSQIEPEADAMAVSDEARARQGLAPDPKIKGVKDPKLAASLAAMTPAEKNAKIAELKSEAKKNFEFSMAVVAGGLAAVVWALKKRENESQRAKEKTESARRDAEARRRQIEQRPQTQIKNKGARR